VVFCSQRYAKAGKCSISPLFRCTSHNLNTDRLPSTQNILDYLVGDAFSGGSGLGVMPAFPILAYKCPKNAATVVREAPMPCICKFHISNLLECDLDPMATLMDREPEPLDIKVLLRMLNLKEHNAACRVPSWLCSKPEQGLVVRPMSCQ
jgi:hypothetical protein